MPVPPSASDILPLLPLWIVVPAVVGALMLFPGRQVLRLLPPVGVGLNWLLLLILGPLALCEPAAIVAAGAWATPLGISLRLDALAFLFLGMTALGMSFVAAWSVARDHGAPGWLANAGQSLAVTRDSLLVNFTRLSVATLFLVIVSGAITGDLHLKTEGHICWIEGTFITVIIAKIAVRHSGSLIISIKIKAGAEMVGCAIKSIQIDPFPFTGLTAFRH